MTSLLKHRIAIMASAGILVLAAGCGGDDETSSSTDTTSTASASTSAKPTSVKDVTAEITTVFETYFRNFTADPALLEDGEDFSGDISGMQDSAASAGELSANVLSVTPLDEQACTAAGESSPCAKVLFDLLLNDAAAVPNTTGYAINQDGHWKVSRGTLCGIASLRGQPPKGC